MALQRRALETGKVQFPAFLTGPLLERPAITIEVPVRREGKPPCEIIVGMEPDIFLSLFEQWNLPEGWLAGSYRPQRQLHCALRNHSTTSASPRRQDFRSAAQPSLVRAGMKCFPSKA